MFNTFNDILSINKNILFPIYNFNVETYNIENNCFDCGSRNPELISVNNGIFICNKCGINHMTFPPGTSILINKESNLISEKELQFLKYGGNKKLYEFILEQCPSLINLPRKLMYISPLLNLYRNHLLSLVIRGNEICRNKMKNIHNNLSTTQIKDDEINYLFSNRTTSNNINNYHNLNYIHEEIQNDKKTLKNLNIIYNKPKLKNAINKLKIEKKEFNETIKTYRKDYSNKSFSTDFDNMNKTSTFYNNDNNLRKSTPIKNIEISLKSISNRKYSSKSIKKNIRNKIFISNFNHKENKINKRKISVNEKEITKSENSENKKYERKIKEIIINKNINKNSGFINNIHQLNTKTFLEQRRPIQVNLSLQNTIDNSQNTNFNKINSFLAESDFNETPTIIITNRNKNKKENKNEDSKSVRNYEENLKESINNIHINLNKNLKKKNKKEKEKEKQQKKIVRNLSENRIKYININFMKKIKNKLFNNDEINSKNNLKFTKKDNTNTYTNNKKNENTIIFNEKNDNESIQKENVSQLQILPIKIFKKINIKQFKQKKLLLNNDNNIYNNKKENVKFYKNLKDNYSVKENRKIISPKRNENNFENKSEKFTKNKIVNNKEKKSNILCNSYKKINQLKNVETFKNSIRNKYKREKSKKKC